MASDDFVDIDVVRVRRNLLANKARVMNAKISHGGPSLDSLGLREEVVLEVKISQVSYPFLCDIKVNNVAAYDLLIWLIVGESVDLEVIAFFNENYISRF